MITSNIKRFGILTSGGDAPGLNAAIRGVCRTAMINYGMEPIGIRNGYHGLITGDTFPITPGHLIGLLTTGGTILGTSREKPFKSIEKDPTTGLNAVESIIKNYENLKLDALVVLGGNGTNTTGSMLSEKGLNVIGLPKTIDNDIVHTDITFGFHTALNVATEAIDRIHTTAHSHSRIMVIEVMGHKAGWLALESGIAGGGDIILLPEIPYNINSVAQDILKRRDAGKDFSIVVVAEGAISCNEALMDKKMLKKTRREMPYSIAYRVAHELEAVTALESRVSVLGYLQRGGTPSPYDRILATQFGVEAAHFLAKGEFGKIVCMQDNRFVGVPLEDVAGKVKNVPLDHSLIVAARQTGTCMGD